MNDGYIYNVLVLKCTNMNMKNTVEYQKLMNYCHCSNSVVSYIILYSHQVAFRHFSIQEMFLFIPCTRNRSIYIYIPRDLVKGK